MHRATGSGKSILADLGETELADPLRTRSVTTVRRKGTSRMVAQNLHESNLAERNVSILGAPRRQDILLINVGKIPRTRRIDLKIGYLVSRKIQMKQVQSKYSYPFVVLGT